MRSTQSQTIKKDEGSSILETALVMPVILLLLVGAIDFGRAYYLAIEVSSSAHAGALYGALNPNDAAGMLLAAKLDVVDLPNIVPTAIYGCQCSDGTSVVANCTTAPTCAFNVVNFVQVTTVGTYKPYIRYKGIGTSFVLHGKSRMRAAR